MTDLVNQTLTDGSVPEASGRQLIDKKAPSLYVKQQRPLTVSFR